jgi:hypothetical protein
MATVTRMSAIVIAALVAVVSVSGSASAAFGVEAFDGQVTADAGGTPFTQAGGHPYAVSTEIRFNTHTESLSPFGIPTPWPDEPVKDLLVDVPPGLVGNPTAVATCRLDQLAYPPGFTGPLCPSASELGVVRITQPIFGTSPPFPVFNMVTPPNVPARFGFNFGRVVITMDGAVRSDSDYGLSVNARNVSEGIPLLGADLTLWGTPASPAHDAERACPGQTNPASGGPACTTDMPVKPFLRLPTSCPANPGQGLKTSLRMDSWWHPGVFQHASFVSHVTPNFPDPGWPGAQQGTTGCDRVPFDPTFTARPATRASPGASGYEFDLNLPQNEDPTLVGESDLKKAVVTLPEGVRVSPSSAGGLGACSPTQIALQSTADPTCPDSSKVGTVSITTPLLDQPAEGSVYLATPHQNPSHSLIAIYIVAKGPGVIIKLAGGVSPSNAANGQLVATFDNQPQLPFSHLHLEFFGGDRAPLSNPPTCGTYTTRAVMTSWSGKTVESDSSFTTSHDGHGAPCPRPQFHPGFVAETLNPIAGHHSPLSITVSRSDDDQELSSIDAIDLPNGLLANISSVKLCAGAAARAGTCGAQSRIGSVTTEAGPGLDPFAVSGRVYLAGRYKHAPFSLSVVVPVVAGPFDLGTVVVRSAIYVDKHNATLRTVTDPLPTILQGIPLQVRLVNVTLDRHNFVINPTSCAPKRLAATIRSTSGMVAHVSNRFQAVECASLGFAPKMTLAVGGKGHVGHRASTPLTSTVTMPKGDANLKSVSVSLPSSLNARLDVVNNACTQAQFESGHCEQARAGTAVAVTPLLPHALRGGVYFVTDPTKPAGSLPNLIVALRGQVDFDLVGKIKIPGGIRLATRFTTVPDVPITKFVLRLTSGSHGPVGNAENLCSQRSRQRTASITFAAQNGKVLSVQQALNVRGCHR